jgi:hypothetical protein
LRIEKEAVRDGTGELRSSSRFSVPSSSFLPAGDSERALEAALHVAARLQDPSDAETAATAASAQSQFPAFNQWFAPSLAQGNAGLAVLWAYLDRCYPERGWDVVGKRHLEIAARAAERTSYGTGMFSGLAGLAFAAWQLSRDGVRYNRLLASLDEAIVAETVSLAAEVRRCHGLGVGEFDVISGLSGIGAYLVCRSHEPTVAVALANAVDALVTLTISTEPLPAWHTPPHLLYDDAARESYPLGNLNCGLAHGAPGILAFLSLARSSGVAVDRLDDAIRTVADWLAANRFDDEWGVNWPPAVPLEQEDASQVRAGDPCRSPGGPARAAWCYGSPGIARALWLAGRAVDQPAYCDLAVAAMEAVFRRPVPARMIDSPTFCHGVAGLLAIALRFARDTGAPSFVDASRTLTAQLLDAFRPDSRIGFRNIELRGNETDQPGLLDGAAGVALVLLAAATNVEPTWDRAFLLA